MRVLDLENLIKKSKMDRLVLAKRLFPKHKHPSMALSRVEEGKGLLDSAQLILLSEILQVGVDQLFTGSQWGAAVSKGKGVFELNSGEYTAHLDIPNQTTKLFHKGSEFHETVLHSVAIPLDAYLASLDMIIRKHKH